MANANYLKGRAFEYKVMKELKEMGFMVMRTAGSHGKYDIIAIKFEPVLCIYFIQCKAYNGISIIEKVGRASIYDVLIHKGTHKEILDSLHDFSFSP